MPRDIIVYEEHDPTHMFGYKDHTNHITIFEIQKCGTGYKLHIDGENPEWITVNGKQMILTPTQGSRTKPVCPQCNHGWTSFDGAKTCPIRVEEPNVPCGCPGAWHHV